MFNFLSIFFSKTVAVIAGTFIAIGGAMGGSPVQETIPPASVQVTSSSQIVAPVIEPASKANSPTSKSLPSTVPTIIRPTNPIEPSISSVPAVDTAAQLKATQDIADSKAALVAQQAADIATQQANQKTADLAAQQAASAAAQKAAQDKQDKLDAVNQQIVALNTKYAADIAAQNNRQAPMSAINGQKQAITTKYQEDYNILMAQWQQIKYSN